MVRKYLLQTTYYIKSVYLYIFLDLDNTSKFLILCQIVISLVIHENNDINTNNAEIFTRQILKMFPYYRPFKGVQMYTNLS